MQANYQRAYKFRSD